MVKTLDFEEGLGGNFLKVVVILNIEEPDVDRERSKVFEFLLQYLGYFIVFAFLLLFMFKNNLPILQKHIQKYEKINIISLTHEYNKKITFNIMISNLFSRSFKGHLI